MSDIIDSADLVPMDIFPGEPFIIDVVYADANHFENIFSEALYDPKARMILYRDMARIVITCARILYERHSWTLVLKDGLRPVEAQARMMDTAIVKKNPQWLEGQSRMLSYPGKGAHPRGMAIDVSVRDNVGNPINMGTLFDDMTKQSARECTGFADNILENRKKLEAGFTDAAARLFLPMLPLASEWWDFRFPSDYSSKFMPIFDVNLPPHLKICSPRGDSLETEAALAKSILLSL